MSFFSKLGQIIDIVNGGFTLPTEEQIKLNRLSSLLHATDSHSKTDLNSVMEIHQEINETFQNIPEGRTVEADTRAHGVLKLQKINGVVRIV